MKQNEINVINKASTLINHISYIIDASGSMQQWANSVVELFDSQIKQLCEATKTNQQETRVSVFFFKTDLFSSRLECAVFDVDVLRCPSIKSLYLPTGRTPMISAVVTSVKHLRMIPETFGNHAHMVFVITDGAETETPQDNKSLKDCFISLPSNWTIGCLVPDKQCMTNAIGYGFESENCHIWDPRGKDLLEVNNALTQATTSFMRMRAAGGTKLTGGIFKIKLDSIEKGKVQQELDALPRKGFALYDITTSIVKNHSKGKSIPIKAFVEKVAKQPFVIGRGFYQLTKTEEIQEYKKICIRDTRNGLVYMGPAARNMIGLPSSGTAKLRPEGKGTYEIFVASTSHNRALLPGTKFIYVNEQYA